MAAPVSSDLFSAIHDLTRHGNAPYVDVPLGVKAVTIIRHWSRHHGKSHDVVDGVTPSATDVMTFMTEVARLLTQISEFAEKAKMCEPLLAVLEDFLSQIQ